VKNLADYRGRFDVLEDLVKGKTVLHIGCADHIQLIKAKMSRDEWLHGHLIRLTKKCLGIDINQKSIDYLRNELGLVDVHAIDIAGEPSPIITKEYWDYAILGEILEHVDNPCLFLKRIRNNYPTNIGHIIVTVPNALSYANVKNSKKDREFINTDHRYWFTPFTLAKVAVEAGYTPTEFFLCDYGRQRTGYKSLRIYHVFNRIFRLVTGRRYIRNGTLVMILKLNT